VVMHEGDGPLLPHVKVRLVGEDGNAFAIMGRVTREMKRQGVPKEIRDAYLKEATSGNYDHLLLTTLKYVAMKAPLVCADCEETEDRCICDEESEDY